jgi:hypothetical protein
MVKCGENGFVKMTSPSTLAPPCDGIHNITVRAFDKAGNYRDGYVDVYVDTKAPEKLSIEINDNTDETNSTSVNLKLDAFDTLSGISSMSFSNDGKLWGDWEDYSETTTYQLPEGDGEKSIYFRVRDVAGNIGTPVAGTILLNTTETTPDIPDDETEDNDGDSNSDGDSELEPEVEDEIIGPVDEEITTTETIEEIEDQLLVEDEVQESTDENSNNLVDPEVEEILPLPEEDPNDRRLADDSFTETVIEPPLTIKMTGDGIVKQEEREVEPVNTADNNEESKSHTGKKLVYTGGSFGIIIITVIVTLSLFWIMIERKLEEETIKLMEEEEIEE